MHPPKVLERTRRSGFSLLEFQVALVLFSLALTGLVPAVALYARHLRFVEQRLAPEDTWYFVPSSEEWARKLGAGAMRMATDPGPLPKPDELLVDDLDPEYFESGMGWTTLTDSRAYAGACRRHAPGTGGTATWTFTDIPPDSYHVLATWPDAPDQTVVAYDVYVGAKRVGRFNANQTQPPEGNTFHGYPWVRLNSQSLALVSGTARVEVASVNNHWVAADAVRLAPIRNVVQVLSLDRSLGSQDVTAQVSVTPP